MIVQVGGQRVSVQVQSSGVAKAAALIRGFEDVLDAAVASGTATAVGAAAAATADAASALASKNAAEAAETGAQTAQGLSEDARDAAAADAVATAADRVQTGLDRVATAADRVQTGLDVTASEAARDAAEGFKDDAENAADDLEGLLIYNLAANLYNTADRIEDAYVQSSGAIATGQTDWSYFVIDLVAVGISPGDSITISANSARRAGSAFYTGTPALGTYISAQYSSSTASPQTRVVPATATHMAINLSSNAITEPTEFMVNKGATALPYEAWHPPIPKLDVDELSEPVARLTDLTPLEAVDTVLAASLDTQRIGSITTPIAGTGYSRTFGWAVPTTDPWIADRFDIYLTAAATVFLKRFDAVTGVQIGSDIPLTGALGLNTFTRAGGMEFSGNAGEFLGFHSPQTNVTLSLGTTTDVDPWYQNTSGNASSLTMTGAPVSNARVEAFFVISRSEAAARKVKAGLLGNARPIVMPEFFRWSPVLFGVNPDGFIAHTYNPLDYRPIASPAAADFLYYVDPDNGDDTTGDGTVGDPFKSLYKAIHNVSSQGDIWIRLMGDAGYGETAVGATITAKNIVIEPYGVGRAVTSNRFKGLSWALVGGTTATYETTCPAAPQDVWDETDVSTYGPFANYLTADAGTGELPAGTRKIDGNDIRVRLHDDREPDDDVKVMGLGDHFTFPSPSGVERCNLWIDSVDIEGGAAFWTVQSGVRSSLWLSNLDLRYGTKADDMFHNYGRCDSILYNVGVYDTRSDGFGYSGASQGIEIDCRGALNGVRGADSAGNVSTGHASARIIRAATAAATSSYRYSSARPIHDVTASTSVNLGITVGDSLGTDYGDVAFVTGNPTSPDGAISYVLNVQIAPGSGFAFATRDNGVIRAANFNRNGVADYETPTFAEWNPYA
jgi:hypothetical protein